MMDAKIHLVECSRDAMQGWPHFIPTEKKIEYINQLLKVGFDTIDFGSFVSAKAIPQMADTKEVVSQLSIGNSKTKMLAIVANLRGAKDAIVYEQITYLGFPFSISPTFQIRNTNTSIESSLQIVEEIQELCLKNKKQLVVYISMGFGNPYGDIYNEQIVMQWVNELVEMDVAVISMADTVGLAEPMQITTILNKLTKMHKNTKFGVHLHSKVDGWKAKVDAALEAGCTRFDGALKGIGGCPMADDELVGNMNTEMMIDYFNKQNLLGDIDMDALQKSLQLANQIFV